MVDHEALILKIIVILSCLLGISSQIINRICADQSCRGTLSIARAVAQHESTDPTALNFPYGKDIRVTTKLESPHAELWGGEINGKFGYFPKTFVKEFKVLNADPQHRVPTETFPLSIREKVAAQETNQQDGNASNDQDFFDDLSRKFEERMIEQPNTEENKESVNQQQKDPTEADDDDELEELDQGGDGDPTEASEITGTGEASKEQKDDPAEDGGSDPKPSGFFQSIGSTLTGMFGSDGAANGGQADPNVQVQKQEQGEGVVHMNKDAENTNNADVKKKLQEEHLAQLRNNFLRRRLHQHTPQTDNDIDDINKMLEEKYNKLDSDLPESVNEGVDIKKAEGLTPDQHPPLDEHKDNSDTSKKPTDLHAKVDAQTDTEHAVPNVQSETTNTASVSTNEAESIKADSAQKQQHNPDHGTPESEGKVQDQNIPGKIAVPGQQAVKQEGQAAPGQQAVKQEVQVEQGKQTVNQGQSVTGQQAVKREGQVEPEQQSAVNQEREGVPGEQAVKPEGQATADVSQEAVKPKGHAGQQAVKPKGQAVPGQQAVKQEGQAVPGQHAVNPGQAVPGQKAVGNKEAVKQESQAVPGQQAVNPGQAVLEQQAASNKEAVKQESQSVPGQQAVNEGQAAPGQQATGNKEAVKQESQAVPGQQAVNPGQAVLEQQAASNKEAVKQESQSVPQQQAVNEGQAAPGQQATGNKEAVKQESQAVPGQQAVNPGQAVLEQQAASNKEAVKPEGQAVPGQQAVKQEGQAVPGQHAVNPGQAVPGQQAVSNKEAVKQESQAVPGQQAVNQGQAVPEQQAASNKEAVKKVSQAVPGQQAVNQGQAIPGQQAASNKEAVKQESQAVPGQQAVNQGQAIPEQQAASNKEAVKKESQAVPGQQAVNQGQAIPGQQAASNKEAVKLEGQAGQQAVKPEGQAVPGQQAVKQDGQAVPGQQAVNPGQAVPEQQATINKEAVKQESQVVPGQQAVKQEGQAVPEQQAVKQEGQSEPGQQAVNQGQAVPEQQAVKQEGQAVPEQEAPKKEDNPQQPSQKQQAAHAHLSEGLGNAHQQPGLHAHMPHGDQHNQATLQENQGQQAADQQMAGEYPGNQYFPNSGYPGDPSMFGVDPRYGNIHHPHMHGHGGPQQFDPRYAGAFGAHQHGDPRYAGQPHMHQHQQQYEQMVAAQMHQFGHPNQFNQFGHHEAQAQQPLDGMAQSQGNVNGKEQEVHAQQQHMNGKTQPQENTNDKEQSPEIKGNVDPMSQTTEKSINDEQGVVGGSTSEVLGGSSNTDKESALNANDRDDVSKETNDISERENTEEQPNDEMRSEDDLQVKTVEDVAKSEDTEAMQNEINKIHREHDTESPIAVEDIPTEEAKSSSGEHREKDVSADPTINNEIQFEGEHFEPEVLELFNEDGPPGKVKNEETEETVPEENIDQEENDQKITPEVIDFEPVDFEFTMEGLPGFDAESEQKLSQEHEEEQNNLEVVGSGNYNDIKEHNGFEGNMHEVEQVSDDAIDFDTDVHDNHFPEETHFADVEQLETREDKEDEFPEDVDQQNDEYNEEDSIVSEEDVIDLMYEDRHLSPYRKIFLRHFNIHPDEDELLALYKQVAGDIFALDRDESDVDSKQSRWKIYNEVYLHHFKESHLRFLGQYPSDKEVSHFQRIFHTHLRRVKHMEPEEMRYEAEFGHLPDDELDDESNFDIPEELHETEENKGTEQGATEQQEMTDPTEADDEEPGDIIEEDLTGVKPPDAGDLAEEGEEQKTENPELDPTDMDGEEQVEEEVKVGMEAEAGDEANKEALDKSQDNETKQTKTEPAGDSTEPVEHKKQEVDEGIANQKQDDEIKPTEQVEQKDVKPSHPEEPDKKDAELQEGKKDGGAEDIKEENKEHIDLTGENENVNVPVSTNVDSSVDLQSKEESHQESQVQDPGLTASEAIEKGKVEQKDLGESSSAPENVAPVPTTPENLEAQPVKSVGSTIVEDEVTTVINGDVTTIILDGTTMIENEDGPEVLLSTMAQEQLEPSTNMIEQTPSQMPASISTPALDSDSKPATDAPDMPGDGQDVKQAEGTITHSHTQHDTPQGTQATDSISLGGDAQHPDDVNLEASGSAQDNILNQEHGSVKTNNGIDTESIVTHTGEPEVAEINAEEVIKAGEVEGPTALGKDIQATNESVGEVPTADSATASVNGLGERLDPYSPAGEYVTRSLHSHEPSAEAKQPDSEPKISAEANSEGAPTEGSEQGTVPPTQETQKVVEQANNNVPSQPVGQEAPSSPPPVEAVTPPPVEEVTPPVVPETDDVKPEALEPETVTEPTPIVEEQPETKEPEADQAVPPTDEPKIDDSTNQPSLGDLPEVGTDFPPLDDNPADPYATDYQARKIPDGESTEAKEEDIPSEGWMVWYARLVDSVIGLFDPVLIAIVEMMPPSIQKFLEHEPFGMPKHRALLMAIGTTIMFSVISMTVVCGKGGKKSDPRIAKYADMEEKYFIASKEKEGLEEALEKSTKEIERLKKRSGSTEKNIEETKSELQTTQYHNSSLKTQVSELQQQLEQVQQTIEQWSASYYAKDAEAQEYQLQVKTLTDAKEDLDKQLGEVKSYLDLTKTSSTDLETKVTEMNEEITILQQSKDQLQLEVETWHDKVDELKATLKETEQEKEELNEKIAFKDNELMVMKDCFKQLKTVEESVQAKKGISENGEEDSEADEDEADGDTSLVIEEKINAMMDVSKVSAQLKAAEEERDHIKQRYEIEIEQRKELEDEMAKIRKLNEKLQMGHKQAEEQSVEASTKLSVLQQYFKEKEVELQKQLGEQEIRKKEKASILANKDETVKTMEIEMQMAKEKVEDLQTEISKVEKDYRTQIAMQEKKAHENWLAARQAERELKESKSECNNLRQKLVELDRLRELDGPGPPFGPGLIRPLPQRGMLPPDMMNGPPGAYRSPPPLDGRPTSRGSGSMHGPQSPPLFRDDFRDSPFSDRPLPPPHMRPPPPLDRDGRPLPPLDRDGRPLPPLDRDGRPLPPLDRDGRPLPPLDRDGRPLPPLDRDGRPLPPLDRDGRPLPPLDRNGRPLPPLDRDGRPLPPFDRDGRPLPPPDQRSPPPPFDRRPPPPHDRTSPPHPRYRSPPPDLPGDRRGPPPPGYRGGPPPPGRPYPPHDGRSPPPAGPLTSSPYHGTAPQRSALGSRPGSRQQQSSV